MSDEWVEKRVADLVVGDEVRDTGVVQFPNSLTGSTGHRYVWFPAGSHRWPSHARVDVRRPVEVTVNKASSLSKERTAVFVGSAFVVNMPCQEHAEWYADRLRGSADERRKALGET